MSLYKTSSLYYLFNPCDAAYSNISDTILFLFTKISQNHYFPDWINYLPAVKTLIFPPSIESCWPEISTKLPIQWFTLLLPNIPPLFLFLSPPPSSLAVTVSDSNVPVVLPVLSTWCRTRTVDFINKYQKMSETNWLWQVASLFLLRVCLARPSFYIFYRVFWDSRLPQIWRMILCSTMIFTMMFRLVLMVFQLWWMFLSIKRSMISFFFFCFLTYFIEWMYTFSSSSIHK